MYSSNGTLMRNRMRPIELHHCQCSFDKIIINADSAQSRQPKQVNQQHLSTKFEVAISTHYEDTKGIQNI